MLGLLQQVKPGIWCWEIVLSQWREGLIVKARIGGTLFADDFVGVCDSKGQLQKLINIVYNYCNKWRLKVNVTKCAVMVFAEETVEGGENIIYQLLQSM